MQRLQSIKNEIDRVNLEIQSAERDYDLNRAAELKYGTVLQLQKQLKQAEEALEKEAVSPSSLCCCLHTAFLIGLGWVYGFVHRSVS